MFLCCELWCSFLLRQLGEKHRKRFCLFFCLLILALLESVNAETLENEKTRKEESFCPFSCISKSNKDYIASGSVEETIEGLGSLCDGFQGNSVVPVVPV